MDNFALYSPSHGFVDSNTCQFIDSLLSQHTSFSLDTYHAPIIPSPLFDRTPPPTYSYLQALSSFSAVVQLYLRSGQLDTSLSLSRCLSNGSQPWCRFGCHAIEDSHHIFIQCPCFDAFRNNAISSILSSSTMLLDASTLDPARRQTILERARGLFYDSDMWPAQRSLYYIGVLPAFPTVESPIAGPSTNNILLTRLANDWHTVSIRLAARIWSESRKHAQERNSTPGGPRKVVSLPSHLESTLPSSYPSLNISFD